MIGLRQCGLCLYLRLRPPAYPTHHWPPLPKSSYPPWQNSISTVRAASHTQSTSQPMSGELPRPIKGTSLHHPHASYTISTHNPNTPNAYHYSPYSYISTAPAPLPHQLSHASSSLARPASGSARRGEFAVPALPHRSLDRAATSAAQSSVFSHSSGSDIPPMPGLVYSATPGAPAGAKRGRRPHIGERHDAIWSQEVQDAFLQGQLAPMGALCPGRR